MANSTVTTLATQVPAEFLTATLIQEARPFNIVAPLVYQDTQPKGQGVVWQKGALPTTTVSGVTEEEDITPIARTTTEATVTVAEKGAGTSLTFLARETARPGVSLIDWAASQGRAYAQKVTGDLCALFAALNSGTAVGTSGVNMNVANFIEAMYTLEAANAPGQKNCVLHPRQWADLITSITAVGGAIFTNVGELVREGRLPGGNPPAGFKGQLFDVNIYATTEVDTASSGADYCGAMFTPGAMAYITLKSPDVAYDGDASARTQEVITHGAYGVGELVDGYGVPIQTDA